MAQLSELEWKLSEEDVDLQLARASTRQLVEETIKKILLAPLNELQDDFFACEKEIERIKQEVENSQQFKDLKLMLSAMRDTMKPFKTANKLRLHFINRLKTVQDAGGNGED